MNGLSLCSGIGGIELGLSIAVPGYRSVCMVEREAYAAALLVARMAEKALDACPIWDDLSTFDGSAWRGCVDIVSAGLPCQPYSVAGKQLGWNDPRCHDVVPHALRIIEECSPSMVFLENVPTWITGGYFRPVGERLSELGYQIETGIFSADEVGASHRRERAFALGYTRQQHVNIFKRSVWDEYQGTGSAFPPPPSGDWNGIDADLKPAVCRVAYGFPYRVDRLRCLGNAVVPLVCAYAFRTLAAAAGIEIEEQAS